MKVDYAKLWIVVEVLFVIGFIYYDISSMPPRSFPDKCYLSYPLNCREIVLDATGLTIGMQSVEDCALEGARLRSFEGFNCDSENVGIDLVKDSTVKVRFSCPELSQAKVVKGDLTLNLMKDSGPYEVVGDFKATRK